MAKLTASNTPMPGARLPSNSATLSTAALSTMMVLRSNRSPSGARSRMPSA